MSIQNLLKSDEYKDFCDSVIIEDEFLLAAGSRCEIVLAALTPNKLVIAEVSKCRPRESRPTNGRRNDLELARLVPLPFLQIVVVDSKQRRIQINLAGSEALFLEHRGDVSQWPKWESNVESLNSQVDTTPFHVDSRLKAWVEEAKEQLRESRKKKKKRKRDKVGESRSHELENETGDPQSRSRAHSLPLVTVSGVEGLNRAATSSTNNGRASFAVSGDDDNSLDPKIEKWQAQNLTPIGESQDNVGPMKSSNRLSQRLNRYKSKSARHRRLSLSIMEVIMVPTRGRDLRERRTRSVSNIHDDDPHHVCTMYMEELADMDRDVLVKRRSLPNTLKGTNATFRPDTTTLTGAIPVRDVNSGSTSLLTGSTTTASSATVTKFGLLNFDANEEVCFLHHNPSRKRRHSLLHQSTKKLVQRPSYINRQYSERRPKSRTSHHASNDYKRLSDIPDSGSRTLPESRSGSPSNSTSLSGSRSKTVTESTSESITAAFNEYVQNRETSATNRDSRAAVSSQGASSSRVSSQAASSSRVSSQAASSSRVSSQRASSSRVSSQAASSSRASSQAASSSRVSSQGASSSRASSQAASSSYVSSHTASSSYVSSHVITSDSAASDAPSTPTAPPAPPSTINKQPKKNLFNKFRDLVRKRVLRRAVQFPFITIPKFQYADDTSGENEDPVVEFDKITVEHTSPRPTDSETVRQEMIELVLSLRSSAVAKQLTMIDKKLFFRIPKDELDDCLWTKRAKYQLAPNIMKMIDFFERIANLVATQVLLDSTPRGRAKIIAKFIWVAYKCRRLQNFNSMRAIIGGLQLTPVFRLEETWDHVIQKYPRKYRVYTELSDLMGHEENFSRYRVTLRKCLLKPPCIPFIGVFLQTVMAVDTVKDVRGYKKKKHSKQRQNEQDKVHFSTQSNVRVVIHSDSDEATAENRDQRQSLFDSAKNRVHNIFRRSGSEDPTSPRRQSLFESAKSRVQGAFRGESEDRTSTLTVPTRRLRSRDNKLSSFQLSDSDLSADEDSKPTFLKLKPNDMLFQYQMAALLYNFESDPIVLDFLLHSDYNTDEENYSLSLLREPRNRYRSEDNSSGDSADDER